SDPGREHRAGQLRPLERSGMRIEDAPPDQLAERLARKLEGEPAGPVETNGTASGASARKTASGLMEPPALPQADPILPPAAPPKTVGARREGGRPPVINLPGELPEGRVDARRFIAEHLWSDPRAEELQAIINIAEDPAGSGPRWSFPRKLIALRSLAETHL